MPHATIGYSLFVIVAWALCGKAEVITYTGDVFPEEVGWDRVGTADGERWLEDGRLNQYVELGDWAPPPGGQQDLFQREISEFGGQPFFMEWTVRSDAPNTELEGVGGSAIAIFGGASWYHFNMSGDTVAFYLGGTPDIVFQDIEPGEFHQYRLEIPTSERYDWFIDGELVFSDTPPEPFPNTHIDLIWGANFWNAESTNEWDYITYGTLPEPTALITLLLGVMMLAKHPRR